MHWDAVGHRANQESAATQNLSTIMRVSLPLIRYEAQPLSLAIRKEILHRRGLIKSAVVRDPATKLDRESLKEIDELIQVITQRAHDAA